MDHFLIMPHCLSPPSGYTRLHTGCYYFQEPEKAAQQMAAAASALPSSHQSEEDLKAQQEAELSTLQQQLQQLSVQMEEVGGDIRQLTVSIHQVMTAACSE